MDPGDRRKKIVRSDQAPLFRAALIFFILILPFLVFYWMIPFVTPQTLGNDYSKYPIHHQLELMFALKTGTFPLFIPGFAGGQSSSALTLGQLFHPISHIASTLPGYWEGHALEWNTFFRLVSLGLAHLLLFAFVNQLRIHRLMAFIVTFITVYNLRMLDLFRYGASLESWTGHLLLCAAIGWYYIRPTKFTGPLAIIGSTYWLVCSGHPQMMYYGLVGAGLFALVIPFFLKITLPERLFDIRQTFKFWLKVFAFCGTGILLASAYIMPFYFDFLADNVDRAGRDYAWADGYRDTLSGTLSNFFQPLRSDVNGVFGGSSLILLVAWLPLLRLVRVKLPAVIWGIWAILILAFLHMQGARTPVHYLAWKYFPFAAAFRVAGRVSMIMPIFFMLILTWIMRTEFLQIRVKIKNILMNSSTFLAALALVSAVVYFFLPDAFFSEASVYSAKTIRNLPPRVESIAFLLEIGALIAFISVATIKNFRAPARVGLCIFTVAHVIVLLQFGTWVEAKETTPGLSRMREEKNAKLSYRLSGGSGLTNSNVVRHVKRTYLEPYLGKIYHRYRYAEDNETSYHLMEESRLPDQVTIEKYKPAGADLPKALSKEIASSAVLNYSSYNRLVFEVRTSVPGFFVLAYPFTGNWKAFVNQQETAVYRANGIAHAIEIPAGVSQVQFRYWSRAAFWGMIISCATLVLMGFLFSFQADKKVLRLWGAVLPSAVVIYGFITWYSSLYNGDNLQTVYAWKERAPAAMANFAYGKRTHMSSLYTENYIFYHNSARAVDGVRDSETGFLTAFEPQPWWGVDLKTVESIGAIKIYESLHGPLINQRPLKVAFSSDRKVWRTVGMLSEPQSDSPLSLEFKIPEEARYVLIRASGTCHLSFDEVEIFPAVRKPDLNSEGTARE